MLNVTPAYWCHPAVAVLWLVEHDGWTIKGKRAYRRGVSIPAPRVGEKYDLHDVACENGVWASAIVKQIQEFVAQGEPPPQDRLRELCHGAANVLETKIEQIRELEKTCDLDSFVKELRGA